MAVLSAATIAASAIPIPRVSVAMCPASEISANDPVRNPAKRPLGLVILAAGIGLDGNGKDSLPPLYPW